MTIIIMLLRAYGEFGLKHLKKKRLTLKTEASNKSLPEEIDSRGFSRFNV
jgi:hypothetical protein